MKHGEDRFITLSDLYNSRKLIPIIDGDGEFLGFKNIMGLPQIINFGSIDKKIIISGNNVTLGEKKGKIILKNIEELKDMFEYFIVALEENIHNEYGFNCFLCYEIEIEERKLLINQLVFDILYDKYRRDQQQHEVTLNDYCTKYVNYNWEKKIKSLYEVIVFFTNYYEEIKKDKDSLKYKEKLIMEQTTSLFKTIDSYEKNRLKIHSDNTIDSKNKRKQKKEIDKNLNRKLVLKIVSASSVFPKNISEQIQYVFKEVYKYNKRNSADQELDLSLDYFINNLEKTLKYEHKQIINTTGKAIKEGIKLESKIRNNPALRADMEKLWVDPNQVLERLTTLNTRYKTDIKRSKLEWDYLYYNGRQKLITSKQYKRTLKIDNTDDGNYRNYLYSDFEEEFKIYDNFVQESFIQDKKDNKDYFYKSMNFYHLESYKRLDYIYKLAKVMEENPEVKIDKEHFLVKYFTYDTIYPCLFNDKLCFPEKSGYYKPLLFIINDLWIKQKKLSNGDNFNEWHKYNLVRAIVYELFKYTCSFASNDYKDISDFIRTDYDILSYHEPHKKWINEKKKKYNEQTMRISNALIINYSLFWESEKRNPVEYP